MTKVQRLAGKTGRARWRRVGAGTAAVALIAVALATGVASGATAASKGGGNLNVWQWQAGTSYIPVFQAAANRYSSKYGGTASLIGVPFASYFTKFTTDLAADSGVPDVMEMSWTGEYRALIDSGSLLPLDKYLPSLPKFYGPILKSLTYKGHVYGIPMDLNTLTIAYNTADFKKLGLKVPTTFAQLLALGTKIRAAGDQPLAVNLMDGWPDSDLWFSQLAYTDPTHGLITKAEAGTASWNNPQFVQAATDVQQMVKSGLIADGSSSLTLTSLAAAFGSGQTVMMYPAGNFDTSLINQADAGKFTYKLFPFPPLTAGKKPFATGGPAIIWSIPAKAPNPTGAINYIRETVNTAGYAAEVKNDFIPSAPTTATKTNHNAIYKQFISFQPTAQTRAIFVPAVATALQNAMQALVAGTETPAQVGTDLQSAAG
jgi:raffinose/stachyose/melibiose transport system substrate-binding protein